MKEPVDVEDRIDLKMRNSYNYPRLGQSICQSDS